jgi:hypothetical protein
MNLPIKPFHNNSGRKVPMLCGVPANYRMNTSLLLTFAALERIATFSIV